MRSSHLILPDMLTNGKAMSLREQKSEENQADAKQPFDFT
jgi:hypothetical protein